MVLHHCLIDSSGSCSLSEFNVGHHEVLFICVPKHIFQILLEFLSQQETSGNLLNFDDFLPSLIEVNFHIISWSITTVLTLKQNTWTVSFENSSKSVNINFKIEKMLLGWFFLSVVWNVKFHEFVETPESVTERCIFDSLFISDYEVVKSQKWLDTVNKEMTIARNAANRVAKKSQVDDLRNWNQWLNVTRVVNVVIV